MDTESMKKEAPLGEKTPITLKEKQKSKTTCRSNINEGWLDRTSWCLKEQRTAMHEQRDKLM